MMKQQLVGIQLLRAIAAIVVVLHHVDAQLRNNFQFITPFSAVDLGARGVTAFFVLSGFIILKVHYLDQPSPQGLKSYVNKRITRIIPFTVIAATIWAVIVIAAELAGITTAGMSFAKWLSSSIMIPLVKPEPGVIWTLRHEMLFYAMFSCYLISRRLFWAVMVFWAVAMLLTTVPNPRLAENTGEILSRTVLSNINFLFYIGMFLAFADAKGFRAPNSKILMIFSICLLFLVTVWLEHREYGDVALLTFGIVSGFSVWVAANLDIQSRVAKFFGDASFAIYLIHPIILPIALPFISIGGHVPLWIVFLLLVSISVFGGCLFYLFVERPIMKFFRDKLVAKAQDSFTKEKSRSHERC